MKKIINDANHVVEEMIEGFIAAYGQDYLKVDGVNALVVKAKKDKVAIVIGGGSGHEPLFFGFVGEGLADGVAIGNVFAAPTPKTVYATGKAVDSGKGVLLLYGNYAGDVFNFDMGAELLDMEGIPSKTVLVRDDVASAPLERIYDRRGIAGDVLVFKVAGAASNKGLSLDEVARVAQKASDYTRSVGVALTPGSIPSSGKPTFTIPDDEIEFGMGIHGEPGVKRTKMMEADKLTEEMINMLINDLSLQSGDEVCILVNGLGSTTLMEMMIVNRKITQLLNERGIKIHKTDVQSYCTTQEMGGVSISLMKLDEELMEYYDEPAFSPYYFKK